MRRLIGCAGEPGNQRSHPGMSPDGGWRSSTSPATLAPTSCAHRAMTPRRRTRAARHRARYAGSSHHEREEMSSLPDPPIREGAARAAPATPHLPYLPGLDGLRAVAVGAVLLYHANPAWLPGGFLGVEVFFVLSGYLITALLLGEWCERGR